MIPARVDQIAVIVGGELRCQGQAALVDHICIDSRGASPRALFIALEGQRVDGHQFLQAAFGNGAAAAIVSGSIISSLTVDFALPLIVVQSPLRALQVLAKWYRHTMIDKVVAITGSNGKTIVKDALKLLLSSQRILASPGSYNSQLGLPLAVLSADKPTPLAVLEVGVSAPGDMRTQAEIAAPDYGILTNVGMAHIAAFGSRQALAEEKLHLFSQIPDDGWVLVPAGDPLIEERMGQLKCPIHRIGPEDPQQLLLTPISLTDDGQLIRLTTDAGVSLEVKVNTRSPHLLWDLHCAATAAHLLGVSLHEIASCLAEYVPTATRMEMWSSPDGIRIINDAHSSDPISVNSALRSTALVASQLGRKIFAFAGMLELGVYAETEHRQVGALAADSGFSHLILVGDQNLNFTAQGYKELRPDGHVTIVPTPKGMQDNLRQLLRPGDTVLFKGPRHSGMVRVAKDLSGFVAQRCLWIDLTKISENLATLRRHCGGVGIIATLKALAYGTELVQLASWMSSMGVRHFAVSTTNEGVAIRKTGADQDILVFLADADDIDTLLRYRLTPVIYSKDLAEAFASRLVEANQCLDAHLKIDTGMHRLGVDPSQAVDIAVRIRGAANMRLTGVCTHFASADDPSADDYTRAQIAVFNQTIDAIRAEGFDNLQVHAANTAATIRFPESHYDLVRVGIGLYGIYPSLAVQRELNLELAIGVTSRIASIREFAAGSKLGYNGTYITKTATRVGIVPFGYDDGLPWSLSGKGHVLVEGQVAPIIGRISMDQMQVDVTHIKGVDVNAEVLLYGAHGGHTIRPEQVATEAGTIAHELLIRLGDRVHRMYVEL